MIIDARAWIEGGVRAEDWLARTLRSSADVREVSIDHEARTVTVWMQSGYRFVLRTDGAVGAFRLSVGAGSAQGEEGGMNGEPCATCNHSEAMHALGECVGWHCRCREYIARPAARRLTLEGREYTLDASGVLTKTRPSPIMDGAEAAAVRELFRLGADA